MSFRNRAKEQNPVTNRRPLQVLSLCTGIGGLDLGLERAGMRCVGQVEIDPFCRAVLDKQWPEVPKHDDVRTAAEWWRSDRRPAVDVVAAGFPCQPWSVAGKQLGRDDPRHLWPAVADVVRDLAPRYVVLENVPRLVSLGGLADVLGDLASLGFDAVWNLLPAAALGAPHLRWRLFILAADPERVDIRVEPWRGGGSSWPRATVAGFDGATWAVADPDSEGQLQQGGTVGEVGRRTRDGSRQIAVADAESVAERARLRARRHAELRRGRLGDGGGARGVASDADGKQAIRSAIARRQRGDRAVESRLGRAFDGVPPWLDAGWGIGWEQDVPRTSAGTPNRRQRLTGLGNAVCPPVAEHIGRILTAGVA